MRNSSWRAWTLRWKMMKRGRRRPSGSQFITSATWRILSSHLRVTSATCRGRSWLCLARHHPLTDSSRSLWVSFFSVTGRASPHRGPVMQWPNCDSSPTNRKPSRSIERFSICFIGELCLYLNHFAIYVMSTLMLFWWM